MGREATIALAALLVLTPSAHAGDEPLEAGQRTAVKVSEQQAPPSEGWPEKPQRPQIDERLLYEYTDQVDAASAVEEILDELAADIAEVGPGAVSPLIIERVDVSDNLDPRYAKILEARLIAALQRKTKVKVVVCFECRTTQMRVQDGAWTVRQGIRGKEELSRVLQQYGARAMLRGQLALRRDPDALALDVQVVSTDTATVLFAEGYRFDARSAMLYRGSDAAASREARRQDLQDRIDGKPHFGHQVLFGAMFVPEVGSGDPFSDLFSDPIVGGIGLYRLYETFGTYRQFRIGLNAGGYFHTSRLAGGILGVSFHARVHRFSYYGPQFFVGGMLGGFLTGGGGNTAMASASVEALLGSRMFVHASLNWVHPFMFANTAELGGLSPQGGVGFQW